MDIFDGSTRKYNAQNPQTLKNRKISFFTWQNFVSELFDSWWNPRSTISLPTSFHTFFCTSTSIKVLFQILQKAAFFVFYICDWYLWLITKATLQRLFYGKSTRTIFIYELPCFYFIHNEIYIVKYEANDCENRSFIQLETRTIILHSVNLRA